MNEFDPKDPLNRCKGEPRTANAALGDYYRMGNGRSLRALYACYRGQSASESLAKPPVTKRFSTICTWSSRFSWVERISMQEQLDRAQVETAKNKALAEQIAKWSERQITVRDRDWNQAEEVRKIVDKILEVAPQFIKRHQKTIKGKNGAPDTLLIREALDIKLMISALSTASNLQRLAAEMETEHSLNENTTPENLEEVRRRRWESIQAQLVEVTEHDGYETDNDQEREDE
jgi:hypothetical protein